MKTKLFFTVFLMIGFCSLSFAQRGHHRNGHSGDNHTSYRYSNYENSYHNNYDRYANRMSKRDRKRLRKLTRKLQERERCAWEDGYVSRRERRRIQDVKYEIDDLLSYYRRDNRYSRSAGYSYRPVCR